MCGFQIPTWDRGFVTRTAATRIRSVVIEIGKLPIRFWCGDSEFVRLIEDRYSGFLSASSEPVGEVEIELTPEDSIDSRAEDVRVTREGEQWVIERTDFQARWNLSTGQGRVRQVACVYSLDSVLRVLLTLVLSRMDGFLLHASSAIRDGGALLFSGMSGAGKTTIVKLAPPDTFLLSDDVSCIICRPDSFKAVGTPFYCGLGRPGENREAPIRAVYLLAHGSENKIEPVEGAAAVRGLLQNVLFFNRDTELTKSVFETVCEFVNHVPVRRLTFVPGASIWDLIR